MNKEKLMELISLAIDKKANISIHFTQYHRESTKFIPVTKEEARELTTNFAEAIGTTSVVNNEGNSPADDYVINEDRFHITCSYIPTEESKLEIKRKKLEELKKEIQYLEEDVILDGMGEDEHATA